MATAKAGPRKTTRTITLKLTEGEADLLLALTGMVGGSKTKSPRKYAQRVYKALSCALGYEVTDTDAYHLGLGSVEFFDYDNHPEIAASDRVLARLTSPGLQLHASFDPKYAEVTADLTVLADLMAIAEGNDVPFGFSEFSDGHSAEHVSG